MCIHKGIADSFLLDLQAQQAAWTENYLIAVVSEKLDCFNQVFLDILNKHALIKIIKLKRRQCAFSGQTAKEKQGKQKRQAMIPPCSIIDVQHTQDWYKHYKSVSYLSWPDEKIINASQDGIVKSVFGYKFYPCLSLPLQHHKSYIAWSQNRTINIYHMPLTKEVPVIFSGTNE